jgi:hypothetical protein
MKGNAGGTGPWPVIWLGDRSRTVPTARHTADEDSTTWKPLSRGAPGPEGTLARSPVTQRKTGGTPPFALKRAPRRKILQTIHAVEGLV